MKNRGGRRRKKDEIVIDGNDGNVICSGDWSDRLRIHPGKDDPGCAETIFKTGVCVEGSYYLRM
jgi:hypothetical protein